MPINANNSFLRKSQKQSSRGVLRQRCSENMLKIYRFFLQKNFIEIALRHECFPVNLQHIFRITFYKNTSGWLLLKSTIRLSTVYDRHFWMALPALNVGNFHYILKYGLIIEEDQELCCYVFVVITWIFVLKSNSHPTKFCLFALMIALQKWWKILFLSS